MGYWLRTPGVLTAGWLQVKLPFVPLRRKQPAASAAPTATPMEIADADGGR